MVKGSENILNLKDYGQRLNAERKLKGFPNTESFAQGIFEKTQIVVSSRTLYRIEHGQTEPDLSLLLAINLTLYGKLFPREFESIVRNSVNENWFALDEQTRMDAGELLKLELTEDGRFLLNGKERLNDESGSDDMEPF